jgi:hypothetical protein
MDVQRLTRTAASLFGDLGTAGALTVRELPDGLGICAWQTGVRGGGTIFVGCDESVLFVASATGFDAGLAAFRQGRRTPAERFRREP